MDGPCDTWDTVGAPSGWCPVLRIRNRWMLVPQLVHFRHFPTVLNRRGELSHILGRPRGSHPPVSFLLWAPIVGSSFTTSLHPKGFHFGHIELEPVGKFAADPLDLNKKIHTHLYT